MNWLLIINSMILFLAVILLIQAHQLYKQAKYVLFLVYDWLEEARHEQNHRSGPDCRKDP